MHARRGTRALLVALAVPLAVAGLTGCRTSPTVAAYVGDGTISVDRLQSAVAERTASADAVAAYAQAHPAEFHRFVLGTLLDQRVYAAAAQHYGVEVSDDAVRARLAELLAAQGSDAAMVFQQAAAQGVSQADLVAQVRELVIAERIAAAAGKAGGLTDEALRAEYAKERDSLARTEVGYIAVKDQATADAVLAQLTADPSSFPTVAAAHPSSITSPQLQQLSPDQIPTQLAQGIAAAKPGTGFTVPVPQNGVVVVFVGGKVIPTFEEARAALAQKAQQPVDQAGVKLVEDVRGGLNIKVNPRYGVLRNGQVTSPQGGVVDILGTGSGSGAGTSGN